jgi:Arc/MetJ-type ribon-helix-helix transcriptional regulator
MNIQLTKPELKRFIDEQVKAGHFSSPAEVVEAGLARLMLDPQPGEPDDETMAAIEEAEAQYERGEGRPWEQVREELRAKYLKR